jgi:hypothetical protein
MFIKSHNEEREHMMVFKFIHHLKCFSWKEQDKIIVIMTRRLSR